MRFIYVVILKNEELRYGTIDAKDGSECADIFHKLFDHLVPLWFDIMHVDDMKKNRQTSIPVKYFNMVAKYE